MNSVKISTLCFFRTESVFSSFSSALSLSSCSGSNFCSSLRKSAMVIEIVDRLVEDLLDLVLVAAAGAQPPPASPR